MATEDSPALAIIVGQGRDCDRGVFVTYRVVSTGQEYDVYLDEVGVK